VANDKERKKRLEKKRARRREKRVNTPIASYRRSLPSLPLPLEVLQALAAGLPKMSDTIVAFAKPLADEFLDRRSDAVAVRSVLKLAAVIWNMTIEADERTGEAGEVTTEQLRKEVVGRLALARARSRAECEVFLADLERRKRELFADDSRIVLDIQTRMTGAGVVHVDAFSRF
jgi:hypothetical protein